MPDLKFPERHHLGKQNWWKSLQFSISLIFFVFLVLASSFGGWAILRTGKSLILDESVKLIQSNGNQIVAKLESRIALIESLATTLANLGESIEPSEAAYKTLLPHIIDYEEKESFIAGGGLWPEPFAFDPQKERRSFFWGRQAGNELVYFDGYNDPESPGYHGEEWYVPTRYVEEGGSLWSRSYMDPYSHQPMVTCSVPMYKNREFTGIATIDLKLEGLAAFFSNATKLSGGYIFAVDRSNKLLSFPSEKNVKAYAYSEGKLVREEFLQISELVAQEEAAQLEPVAEALERINKKLILSSPSSAEMNSRAEEIVAGSHDISTGEAQLIAAMLSHPLSESLAQDTLSESLILEKDPLLGQAALVHIFLVPKTYWKVVIVTPYEQAIQASNSISKSLLINVVIILSCSFIVLFVLTRKLLVVPLRKMAAALAETQQDSSGFSIRLDDSIPNELGHVASLFNHLNRQLAASYAKIHQSEIQYRQLFINLQDVLFQTDMEGRILLASPAMIKMFGYQQHEVIGQRFTKGFYHDQQKREALLHALTTRGQVEGFEIELIKKDGTVFWASISARLLYDEENAPIGTEGLIRDIDVRKKNEATVHALQLHLKNILESMPSILISVDNDGLITQFNSAATALTGLPPEQVLGQPLKRTIPCLQQYEAHFAAVTRSTRALEFHRECITGVDNRIFNVTLFPLVSSSVEGVVIWLDDVTDQENKERQLIQAQKMETIGTLSAGIAHNFNNLLSGVMGASSLMRYKLEQSALTQEEIHKHLKTIEGSSQRAAELVKQLLTVAREQEVALMPVNLNTKVKNSIAICGNTLDKSIELVARYAPVDAMIKADPLQIEQVLLNLCVNSGHAMTIMRAAHEPRGGQLTVQVSEVVADEAFCALHPDAEPGEYWCVLVSDTGVGMNEETKANIFNPFFTTKATNVGTGLGLATVYTIVKQHNGFLTVHSEPGIGTTFKLYFPEISRAPGRLKEKQSASVEQGTGTILLVDDQELVLNVGSEMLAAIGYEVITAENGLKGLELYRLQQNKIALVILDMDMPVMGGEETFIHLKQYNPDVKVILATGFKEDERIGSVLRKGADRFIQKPYTLKVLSQTIAEVLNRH